MIKFKITKQSFELNTFFTKKTTPIDKTLNSFGYIRSVRKGDNINVYWYDNYKRRYPYYNSNVMRGNIWKHSYLTLLTKINPEKGFSQIKVDKMTYKINPVKGNDVEISDAKYVLKHNITALDGKIIKITNHSHPSVYDIKTSEGVFSMSRNCFSLSPQDYFVLLSIRC
jgi:hypothetical protein